MNDLLTFIPNINVFRQALKDGDQTFVSIDDEGDVRLLIDKIPTKANGNKTLSLCRCNAAQGAFLESISSVDIIGEDSGGADYVFKDDAPDRAKYAQVYDRVPIEVEPGVFYTPPLMIGVFA